MKRNILYYPTINIPTDDWLRNALLYWDEVSSIIPQDWEDNYLIELSSDIKYLIEEEQFRAIRPESLFLAEGNRGIVSEFQNEFINTVKSFKFQSILRKNRDTIMKLHGGKIPMNRVILIGKGAKIYKDKLNYGVIDFLKDEKLLTSDKGDPKWFRFETNTALLYMSFLAKYLARVDRQQTVIGTDNAVYENFNFQKISKGEGATPILTCDFKGLIPSPSKNASIKDILKFKRKRKTNLIEFRKSLFNVQMKIANAESNEQLKEVLVSFQEDLSKGVKDLAAVFKDSKIDLIFKSLKSLSNYKSSALMISGAVLLNQKYDVTGLPNWVKGIAIAVAGSIDIGSNYIDLRNKQQQADRDSAFSYFYHAQKNGIVNRFDQG